MKYKFFLLDNIHFEEDWFEKNFTNFKNQKLLLSRLRTTEVLLWQAFNFLTETHPEGLISSAKGRPVLENYFSITILGEPGLKLCPSKWQYAI